MEYDYYQLTTADEMHLYIEGDHACMWNILEGYDVQETNSYIICIKGTTIVNTAIQVKVLIVNIDLKGNYSTVAACFLARERRPRQSPALGPDRETTSKPVLSRSNHLTLSQATSHYCTKQTAVALRSPFFPTVSSQLYCCSHGFAARTRLTVGPRVFAQVDAGAT